MGSLCFSDFNVVVHPIRMYFSVKIILLMKIINLQTFSLLIFPKVIYLDSLLTKGIVRHEIRCMRIFKL